MKKKTKKKSMDNGVIKIRRISEDVTKAKIDSDDGTESFELQRQMKGRHKDPKKWYRFSRKDRKNLKKKAEISYLITMKFLNGTRKTFVIITKNKTFKFRKQMYYLYYEEAWYDLSMNQYHLEYIENCSVPINRELTMKGKEAFHSVTPDNLEPLIKFEYVKVLAGSHSFDKVLKTILVVSFINLAISVINLLIGFGGGK